MNEKNGYVRWWQLATLLGTLLGVFVTLMVFGAKEVIAVDERANIRYQQNKEAVISLLKDNAEAHQRIIGDLSEMRALLRKGISVRD